eukprot:COSAG02_NODE_29634_length_565_cov_8.032189_2_plen_57_part_01
MLIVSGRGQVLGLDEPERHLAGEYRRYSWLNVVLLIYCAFTIPVRVSFDFELGNFMS